MSRRAAKYGRHFTLSYGIASPSVISLVLHMQVLLALAHGRTAGGVDRSFVVDAMQYWTINTTIIL